jgi:hypothetical protein
VPTSRPSSKATIAAGAQGSTKDAPDRRAPDRPPGKAGPRSRTAAKIPAEAPPGAAVAQGPQGKAPVVSLMSVRLPVVHARVPMVRVQPPEAAAAQTRWMAQAVRANLPSTERLVYYGGLAALAVAGMLEWPVAAAVGVGVWVATRAGRPPTSEHHPTSGPEAGEPGSRRLTATVDGSSGAHR